MASAAENTNKNELTIRQSTDGFSYVIIDNSSNTFVPEELYQERDKSKYLDILGLTDGDCEVAADYIKLAEAYNIYSIPKNEYESVVKLQDGTVFRHASSVLLENLIKDNLERTDDTRVYLYIKNQSFEMMVLKGYKLLFDNHFRFKTKEDFLYFLLFTLEQLHLEAESVPVYFLGMIEEDSLIVEMTSRYVRDIRFKKNIKCEL